MADSRFGLYTAILEPDATPGNDINFASIDEFGFSPNSSKAPYRPGGAIDLAQQTLVSAEPAFNFSTCDILTVLGNISPTAGLSCTGGARFAQQKREEENTFVAAATAEHILYTLTKAFACVESFEVNQDDEMGAKIGVNVWPLSSDGLTSPITRALSAITALPTPAFVSRYFMGRVDVNSTQIGGVTGYTINYGKNYQPKRFNGDVWPQCGSIVSRNPTVTIRSTAGDLDSALNIFTNQVAGTMELYAYQESTSTANARTALASAAHIKHTVDGEWSVSNVTASGENDADFSFDVTVVGTVTAATTATAA